MPNFGEASILGHVMKTRVGIVLLILICAGLVGALIWLQKQSGQQRTRDARSIESYSNQVVKTSALYDQQRQYNAEIVDRVRKQDEVLLGLTNTVNSLSSNLEKSQASLKATQEEVAKRDTRIAALESQNHELDQRALDLSTAITNLTVQIDDTRQKLAASEGDKAFLEKELSRLMAEKAELERQFNDLKVLRTQVAKLKEELNISRRLRWIREGLFARASQKGAQQLMQKAPLSTNRPPARPAYNLNVEVSSDGSVKVIPPLTNNPAASAETNSLSPAAADTNAPPAQ